MKNLFFFSLALLVGSAIASPTAVIHTSMGDVTVELDEDKAPATVANFRRYAEDGFYNGTIFHRVIPGFMIQGGGHTADLKEKPAREPIANEAHNGLKNLRGTIAMARTSNPHSATSQFFINLVDNDSLNPGGVDPYGYAVFGKVTTGLDVVDAIAKVPTEKRPPHANVPTQTITIDSVDILPEAAKEAKP
ncbi:MAG: peptidylprolyl isomerase [Cardiobacteriaceae bacterium]|nr:peptidylprolyl isomerase [Cardiobacteriaceae bacterium]